MAVKESCLLGHMWLKLCALCHNNQCDHCVLMSMYLIPNTSWWLLQWRGGSNSGRSQPPSVLLSGLGAVCERSQPWQALTSARQQGRPADWTTEVRKTWKDFAQPELEQNMKRFCQRPFRDFAETELEQYIKRFCTASLNNTCKDFWEIEQTMKRFCRASENNA